jgi:FSR family fosmidomycin resistance protein-like MFS transporter
MLLPVWQLEFTLAYAQVGLMRALYVGAMAGFQLPAGVLAERIGARGLLALGTLAAGAGFLLAGASTGFAVLAGALVCGGLGASVQHPLSSSLISRAFDPAHSRMALGTYNATGDVGKMALPALTAGLLLVMAWRPAVMSLGVLGFVGAALIYLLLPAAAPAAELRRASTVAPLPVRPRVRRGFLLLLAIGAIDTATRMGFLTFLPFLLQAKGAHVSTLGLALTLVFAGGAVGKLVCGYLGARMGLLGAVFLTEGLTAVGIVALLPLPLEAALVLLPGIGVALNGTSSVLYGTLPELVPADRRERAFGLFYTSVIGAGAVSPILYGLASDAVGVPTMMCIVAGVVLVTLPLAWALRPALAEPTVP